jgi:hypothetical protein
MDRITSAHEHARIVDAAKARAAQLRAQAIEDFFGGAAQGAGKALRSAQRLAYSLARHQRLRQARTQTG